MGALLARLATSMNRHRRAVVIAWALVIGGSVWFAIHQQDHLQGGGWEVPGSQAKRADDLLRTFNGFSVAGLAVVVDGPTAGAGQTTIDGDRYRMMICCAPTSTLDGPFSGDPARTAARIAREANAGTLAQAVAAVQPPGNASRLYATGKSLSNLCADVIELETPAEIAAAAASVPPAWRGLVRNAETTPPVTAAACEVWGVPPSPRAGRAPVESPIPAIVLTTEWDQIIHPDEGRSIADTLGNAQLYTFPGLGHIALLNFRAEDVSCPRGIAVAFVDDPSRFPSGACSRTMAALPLAPKLAGSQVPFKAAFAGTIAATGASQVVLTGTGTATFMGEATNEAHVSVMHVDNSCPGGFVAASNVTLTAEDGDTLTLAGRDVACPTTQGKAHEVGVYVVTGGTGRFEGATGEGTLEGNADTENARFTFTLDGTVSLPAGG